MQAEAGFLDQVATSSTYAVLARVSPGYPPLPGRSPTCYSPVRRSPVAEATFAHDLHVLSTPPAFILSQDQTLQFVSLRHPGRLTTQAASAFFGITRTYPEGSAQMFLKSVADSLFSLSSFQRTDIQLAKPTTNPGGRLRVAGDHRLSRPPSSGGGEL